MRNIYKLSLLPLLATAAATPAWAQSTAGNPAASPSEAPAASNDQLGDIVVTATKKARAEELQRVPIAVTAFGRAQIENTFASNITDIAQAAPNVRLQTVGSVPGVANYTIRGMGFNSSIPSDESTVGVIIDGVYLASNFGSVIDNFDLESIEILRGPQGTLFGRNVTAGAVVIRTRRPTGRFGMDALLNVGNGGRKEASFAVEDAISPTLSGRISVSLKRLDGFFQNAARPGRQVDFRNDISVRPTLVWKPDDATSIALIGQYSRQRDGGTANRLQTSPTYGLQATGYRLPADPRVLDQDFPAYSNQDVYSATLEVTREIGNGVLTSITGYRNIDYRTALDQDGTSVALFINRINLKQHQLSEELRYAGTTANDALDYTVGVYAFTQKFHSQNQRTLPLTPARSLATDGFIKEDSISIFGQLEWRFADTLALTAGVRGNYDRKKADLGYGVRAAGSTVGDCSAAAIPAFQCTQSFHDAKAWKDVSPKLGLTWKPDAQTLVFASATRGFRSGGYNARNFVVTASPGPYDPERVNAFELGIKRDHLDGRLRTNVTAFYNQYKDLQRTVLSLNGTSTILNAASADIWGVEFEGAVIPFSGFRINGTLGYTNASYGSFNGLDLTGDGVPDPLLAKNLTVERAPKWTWSVSGNWDIYTGSAGAFAANAIYSYTAKMPVDTANTFFLGAYKLLDASLRWTTADKHMSVSIYGKNLTNEYYGVTGFNVSVVGRGVYLGNPRSYGVEARFTF